ncbi:MAG: conjugal transfer protein TraK [Muricauda sp.]|nr:conjugal transfer protein TraK [Allomuricauda sp.]MBO6533311.1 conjugal transfer protein TraK [Allomuricauda sp.]MBO6588576.1 conjugal transfer protein TraK [Allomuricauda sp.]MBO6618285.1 conjugal transfer protein TraK [Allomuricauda sp.]MBO6644114.1 conjugal transfer protein TraK [Allomuricauda sp.]MBO6746998.1 conjugal transfer protein TraK [Allomuricauda sp.]
MKTPFKNIQQVLRLNRIVVLALIVMAGLVCITSTFLVIKTHKDSLNQAFVVSSDGAVIPLQLADERENLEVEALAHLEQFHSWFYGVEANSYEKNMEKALWLGNASVDAIYRQKKADGFYNRLLQYSLVQQVERIDSQIDMDQQPYAFQTRTLIRINRGTVTDTYELITTGKLITVARHFPHNPHGLLITDFFENSLRKIESYETTEE